MNNIIQQLSHEVRWLDWNLNSYFLLLFLEHHIKSIEYEYIELKLLDSLYK